MQRPSLAPTVFLNTLRLGPIIPPDLSARSSAPETKAV